MSAPAAKAFSLPVMTIAPIELSLSNLERALLRSVKTAEERALRAFGRFKVTVLVTSAKCYSLLSVALNRPRGPY